MRVRRVAGEPQKVVVQPQIRQARPSLAPPPTTIDSVLQGKPAPVSPLAFPDAVTTKTARQTFNQHFYYLLDAQGRIWMKSIPTSEKTKDVAREWKLVDMPKGANRITAISADQDEILARSDQGRFYSMRWFPNDVFADETPPQTWTDLLGWPTSGALTSDPNVRMALGRRTRNYTGFEDPLGRYHDGGGGLSTYYLRGPGGRSIEYTDSGLSPSFTHQIGSPDRSTFIMENHDVAADTLFVVNAYGELYTRIADFDASGPDSMFFEYDYSGNPTRPEVIALPGEDWLKHKVIPLEGKAQISTQLAIATTGAHNKDRELRVAGYDRFGNPGYYYKRIFDQTIGSPVRLDNDPWHFQIDRQSKIDPMTLLDPADTDPDPARAKTRVKVSVPRWEREAKPPRRAPVEEMRFSGALNGVRAEIKDFQFENSPMHLTLSDGKDSVVVTLHTVEKWSHLSFRDPEEYQVTLEIPPEAWKTKNPALKKALEQMKAQNLKSFSTFLRATKDYVAFEGPGLTFFAARDGRPYPSLAAAERDALQHTSFTEAARAKALTIGAPLGECTDIGLLKAKIAENEKAKKQLRFEQQDLERQEGKKPFWLRGWILALLGFLARIPLLIRIIKPLLPFKNVSVDEAKYYTLNLSRSMPGLLERTGETKELLEFHSGRDLKRAEMLIDARIEAYKRRIGELEAGKTTTSVRYSETTEGAFAPYRFGTKQAGAWTVSDAPMFEANARKNLSGKEGPYGLSLDDGQGHVLRVVPTALERDVLDASASKLDTPVRIQVERGDLFGGKEVEGRLVFENGHYRIKARGLDVSWAR